MKLEIKYVETNSPKVAKSEIVKYKNSRNISFLVRINLNIFMIIFRSFFKLDLNKFIYL